MYLAVSFKPFFLFVGSKMPVISSASIGLFHLQSDIPFTKALSSEWSYP